MYARRLRIMVLLLPLVAGACDDTAESTEAVVSVEPGDPAFERDPALDVENVSEAGAQKSHNAGLNCMQCHQSRGPGLGQFTVAGTIYGPDGAPTDDAILELWTAPNGQGERVAVVEADAYGNVFSTEPLPLPEQRLFVSVSSSDGTLAAAMPFPISSGSCNHCHAGGFAVTLAEAEDDHGMGADGE